MHNLSDFDAELDRFLRDFPDPNDSEGSLRLSLDNAKIAAKNVGIYSKEVGSGSYHTIKAALDLAVAVWDAEKQHPHGTEEAAHQLTMAVKLTTAVWNAKKQRR